MNSDLATATARLRSQLDTLRPSLDLAAAAPTTAARVASGAFARGDRVLDVATGYVGIVTGAGLMDALQRNDVRVQLDDGRVVLRSPAGLLFRPTQPAPG